MTVVEDVVETVELEDEVNDGNGGGGPVGEVGIGWELNVLPTKLTFEEISPLLNVGGATGIVPGEGIKL